MSKRACQGGIRLVRSNMSTIPAVTELVSCPRMAQPCLCGIQGGEWMVLWWEAECNVGAGSKYAAESKAWMLCQG